MSSIYLAARYDQHPLMRQYARFLVAVGHDVTSRWIHQHEGEDAADGCTVEMINQRPSWAGQFAAVDIQDVLGSDTIIVFTEWQSTTGGRHVELGAALAHDLRIVIVGRLENIFQAHPGIEHHETRGDFERAWGMEVTA